MNRHITNHEAPHIVPFPFATHIMKVLITANGLLSVVIIPIKIKNKLKISQGTKSVLTFFNRANLNPSFRSLYNMPLTAKKNCMWKP